MVRVPGRVSVDVLVERAARVLVYVNNHDSAILTVMALVFDMKLSSSLGLLSKS